MRWGREGSKWQKILCRPLERGRKGGEEEIGGVRERKTGETARAGCFARISSARGEIVPATGEIQEMNAGAITAGHSPSQPGNRASNEGEGRLEIEL